MNKRVPLVSVIIPTFNRAGFLPDALASVYVQKSAALQVIVVDDGSTDNTAALVREWGVDLEYVYQTHCGNAAARNTGIRQAKGEWVTFLDSDDVWPENGLRRQLELTETYPSARVIWGRLQIMRQHETNLALFEPFGLPVLNQSFETTLIHRTLFESTQVGLLNESLFTGPDADWFCRLFEQRVEIVVHQEVVAFYRWHQTNLIANRSTHREQAMLGLLNAFARALERRRQRGGGDLPITLKPIIRMVESKGSA
jgi:glycosyltransferase involved in cell wall biosynthesis